MWYNTVLWCCIMLTTVHHVNAQSAISQDSSNKTIIIIISVAAAVVAVAIIVAIVAGCLYFKRSVKEIRKKHMKIIVNSTTKNMMRVERLGTMDEFYKQVEADESGLFPEIPEESEEAAEEVSNINEDDADEIEVEDITDVVEVVDEVTPEVDNTPRGTDHTGDEDKVSDNDKNIESKDGKTFFLKKEPSFLNFIVKENWKRPKVPDIPKSRLDKRHENIKRKRATKNTSKSIKVPRLRSKKKLKKLRPKKHRYDYFMKPIKTKVSTYKWNKHKPRSKLVPKQNVVNVERPIETKLMSVHEEQ